MSSCSGRLVSLCLFLYLKKNLLGYFVALFVFVVILGLSFCLVFVFLKKKYAVCCVLFVFVVLFSYSFCVFWLAVVFISLLFCLVISLFLKFFDCV